MEFLLALLANETSLPFGKAVSTFRVTGETHILIASDMNEIISFFDGNLSSVVFFFESPKRDLPA